jgi:hypothetical protein
LLVYVVPYTKKPKKWKGIFENNTLGAKNKVVFVSGDLLQNGYNTQTL